jgi:hypothetical protein
VSKEKQKHKSICVGLAVLRSALVERGQSLRRVKCFPVGRKKNESEKIHYFFILLLDDSF